MVIPDAAASNFANFIIIDINNSDTDAAASKFSNFIIIDDNSSDTDAAASKFSKFGIIVHGIQEYVNKIL